ncbi:MAG: ThiF family adenylyltransferase [Pseudomonadales bacterium]|nr:ThiF family adenylyltransferase [Pseudomonadales bacterium]MCP5303305.1 ThiF family adenylyltransferase [Pseudomonadales bacterium]
MTENTFKYRQAFSRNTGWVTPDEQQILRCRRVAIAGLGGVGGSHLITLTRLGVGKFNISDFDKFGIENFNRQFGAAMSTVEQPKMTVLAALATDINPELEIRGFDTGINEKNVDEFLQDVDLYVDSLDFFSIKARRLLFSKCAEKDIPAITAAPLGMGCAYLGFLPGKMSFEDYFKLEGHDETEQLIRFLVGLAPARLQNRYLVYPQAVDIPNKKGPSTPLAIELCAGVAGTEALKILLHRGEPIAAPWGMQVDAYSNQLKRTYRPWGNNHPIQQLSLIIGRKKFGEALRDSSATAFQPQSTIEKILDSARWTPSGDNSQPWCFTIINEHNFQINVEIDNDNPYEYNDGEPTLISTGMLLETIGIAASRFGLKLNYDVDRPNSTQLVIQCVLESDPTIQPDNLFAFIKTRSVNRCSYKRQKLSKKTIALLTDTLHPQLSIHWYETLNERWNMVKLNTLATDIRLRLKSCYAVHTNIIDWTSKQSPSGVPASALGLDRATLFLMKWAMEKWERINFMNNYLGATLTARLQMDVLPGLNCAAHFAVTLAPKTDKSTTNLLSMGASLQRFWLTATKLGLAIQPGLAPLCFANRSLSPKIFNSDNKTLHKAQQLDKSLRKQLHQEASNALFLGRVGYPKSQLQVSRSVRLSLERLIGN